MGIRSLKYLYITDKPSLELNPPFPSFFKASVDPESGGTPRPKRFCPDPLDDLGSNNLDASHASLTPPPYDLDASHASLTPPPYDLDASHASLTLPMDLDASPTSTAMQPAFSSLTSPNLPSANDLQALMSYMHYSESDCRLWTLYLHSKSFASSLYVVDIEEQYLMPSIEKLFSMFLNLLYIGADATKPLKGLVGLLISGSLLRIHFLSFFGCRLR